MGAPTSRAWSRALLPLALLANQVSAGAIAAWYTDRMGATLMMQDDDTGLIRYSFPSLCHYFDPKPKKGSALAGVGWFDNTQTQASIWFQDENDDIINSNLHCDMNTGYWSHGGSYTWSWEATTGYRVFYRDTDSHLHWIAYISGSSGWSEYGTLSNDEMKSNAIAAGFTEGNNITVVTPKNNENMEVARLNDDKSWHINGISLRAGRYLPRPLNSTSATNATNATSFQLNTKTTPNYTLPAWDGQPSTMGLHIDSKFMRSVFYIGTDNELYQVSDAKDNWALLARQDAKTWPKADSPKAPLAVASNYGNNELRLYYVSGGQVVEVNGDGRKWQAAKVLPNYNKSIQAGAPRATRQARPALPTEGIRASRRGPRPASASVWQWERLPSAAPSPHCGACGGDKSAPTKRRRSRPTNIRDRKPNRRAPMDTPTAAISTTAAVRGRGGAWPVQDYGAQQQQNWGAAHNQPVEKVQKPGELDGPPIYEMNNGQQYFEMAESRPRHEMMGEGHCREIP
ncbi:hypothetical protein PG994_007644 [Apiospora phragmitis]|uniref:Fucose-specific lectin n=1 Tax=Apiospora phragmitis TaxID=2905665 RepID=A0ABR1UTX7_9PEZI